MPRSKIAQAVGLIVLAYWVLMFVGTHVPVTGRSPDVLKKLGEHPDKLAHCVAYAGLAFLLCTVASMRWGFRQSLIAAVLGLLMLYGAVDESTQALVPSRSADEGDWVADVLGAGLGLAAFSLAGEPLLRTLLRAKTENTSQAAC